MEPEVGVEALSLLNAERDEDLCPPLKDLSDDSIASYLKNHPSVYAIMSGYPNYFCLLCSKRTSPQVERHAASAKHENAVGAFCIYCNSFLISNQETGFGEHLKSSIHKMLFCNKDNIRKPDLDTDVTPKTEEKLTEEENVSTQTQENSLRQPRNNKINSTLKTLPSSDDKQCLKPKPLFQSQEKNVTYFISGFLRHLDVPALYNLCQKFGAIQKLALNPEQNHAYVTYCNLPSEMLDPKIFGPHTNLKKIKYMPKGIINNEWIVWDDHEHITPTSAEIFSFKSKIEKMVADTLEQCQKETTSCLSNIKRIKAEFIQSLKPVFAINNAMFFGSALIGVTPRSDILYFFIDLSTTDDKSPDVVTYLKENTKFYISGIVPELGFPVLYHHPTDVKFVLDTKNSSGYLNDCYIRTYMAFENRATWLIIAFREWWIMNMSSFYISSYNSPVEWLVLFFMMQPHTDLVPTMQDINSTDIKISVDTTGKEIYGFGKLLREKFKPSLKKKDNIFLLIQLFLFYKDMDFVTTLMSPLTGDIIRRSKFSVEDQNFASFFTPQSAAELLKSPMILLHPLQPSLNLFHNCDTKFVQVLKSKLESTIKTML